MGESNRDSSSSATGPAGRSPAEAPDFARLRRRLAHAVARVCPGWLADRREDIVQAALLRVLEVQKKREQESALPSSYLWKVAHSATVDEIRRTRRRREIPLETERGTSGPVSRSTPSSDLGTKELGRAINDCLRRLIEGRRLVVGLYLMGHTLAESEELTGWGAKKVRNLRYRGLAELRRCLEAKGLRP